MPVKFRFIVILLLGFAFYFSFSQKENRGIALQQYDRACALALAADKLSMAADIDSIAALKQETLNGQALEIFKNLTAGQAPALSDSLLFFSYSYAGILSHYFDSITQAKNYYLSCINLKKKLPGLADSFLFKPMLFTANIYYRLNLFDSALLFYKRAETVASLYAQPLQQSERLYNGLGIINNETGNYRLAKNYFEKAIASLNTRGISYEYLLVNYRMNIASILMKLEEYRKADTVLQSILPFNTYNNEINHNLGIIRIRTGQFPEALPYLRKVKYDGGNKSIELFYNFAKVFSGLHQSDSFLFYQAKAMEANAAFNKQRKNIAAGQMIKLSADELVAGHRNTTDTIALKKALGFYQDAICQFYPAYDEHYFVQSPTQFSGVFSFGNLFQTLIAKGDALKKWYELSKNSDLLLASFNAFKSAFALADYVARSYDSDEARLFLSKIKYEAHDKAIKSSLAMYEAGGDKQYLEEAYFFDQKNKAAALTIALQETDMQKSAGISSALSLEQKSLRAGITRLSIKAARTSDSAGLMKLTETIRDEEIKLAAVQEKINRDPRYAGLESSVKIPSIAQLQSLLDDKTTLLSYHLSAEELLVFCVNQHHFDIAKQPVDSQFRQHLQSFITSLHNIGQGERYQGEADAINLYGLLIRPLLPQINHSSRLIIIPDDELNYIPFEALQDEHKNFLLRDFAVQYQYSTALLQMNSKGRRAQQDHSSAGFAPFTKTIAGSPFPALPSSREEMAGLNGKIFYDSGASKKNFISFANHYPVVQLATHAAANDEYPMQSFIAFYPQQKDSTDEHLLYAREIYDLALDSIHLIILSACETGSGKLVQGEGLMSLTRAFAYAGCPNIVTSQWRAADNTTAYLTRQLNDYLRQGYSIDRALQLAKQQLLDDKEISPSLKTPNYWAHLVFIGNYEPQSKSMRWLWIAAGIVAVVFASFMRYKKKSRRVAGSFFGSS